MKHPIQYINEVDQQLFEMAYVGDFGTHKKLYIIMYMNDPSNIPHFHFYDTNDGKGYSISGCIKLLKPEYFPHGNNESVLNSKQKKQLVVFLKTTNPKVGVTYWQYIIMTWNINNSNQTIPLNTPMPDYTLLP